MLVPSNGNSSQWVQFRYETDGYYAYSESFRITKIVGYV